MRRLIMLIAIGALLQACKPHQEGTPPAKAPAAETQAANHAAGGDPAADPRVQQARQPNTSEPQWVFQHKDHRADTALVFVHGIFGDTLGTWLNSKGGKHFYDLVAEDPELGSQVDIFAFGFPSAMVKGGGFTIQEAANRLYADLQHYNLLQYPRIVLVAHSMGGLVSLNTLLTHRDLIPKIPLLVFFSTPQEGAQVTTIARWLIDNPALEEMLPADRNTYLQTLNDQWKSLGVSPPPQIACAYEKLPIAGVVIVPWSSATRFCDGAAQAVETDHIDIVKPESRDSDSYIALSNALKAHALGPAGATPTGAAVNITDLSVGHLQDPSAAERASKPQLGTTLRMRGSLNLTDKTLILPPSAPPKTYTLAADTLWLTGRSRIVTNGNTLRIFANAIRANDAYIVSYAENTKASSEPAGTGGEVDVDVTTQVDGTLHVDLHGQDGVDGPAGLPGPNGTPGDRGESGADHLFDCAHGAGDGKRGNPGQPGTDGKPGGNGGNGGRLVVDPSSADFSEHLFFKASGGQAGRGGAAGAGGKGGPGGSGGSGTAYCRSGGGGPQGPDGLPGNPGKDGLPGRDQTQVERTVF